MLLWFPHSCTTRHKAKYCLIKFQPVAKEKLQSWGFRTDAKIDAWTDRSNTKCLLPFNCRGIRKINLFQANCLRSKQKIRAQLISRLRVNTQFEQSFEMIEVQWHEITNKARSFFLILMTCTFTVWLCKSCRACFSSRDVVFLALRQISSSLTSLLAASSWEVSVVTWCSRDVCNSLCFVVNWYRKILLLISSGPVFIKKLK